MQDPAEPDHGVCGVHAVAQAPAQSELPRHGRSLCWHPLLQPGRDRLACNALLFRGRRQASDGPYMAGMSKCAFAFVSCLMSADGQDCAQRSAALLSEIRGLAWTQNPISLTAPAVQAPYMYALHRILTVAVFCADQPAI